MQHKVHKAILSGNGIYYGYTEKQAVCRHLQEANSAITAALDCNGLHDITILILQWQIRLRIPFMPDQINHQVRPARAACSEQQHHPARACQHAKAASQCSEQQDQTGQAENAGPANKEQQGVTKPARPAAPPIPGQHVAAAHPGAKGFLVSLCGLLPRKVPCNPCRFFQ